VSSPVKVVKDAPATVPVLQGVFDPWAKEKPAVIKNVRATGLAQAAAAGQSVTVTASEANQVVVVSFEVEDAVGRVQPGSFEVIPRAEPNAPNSVRGDPGGRGEATVTWAPVTGTDANGEPVDSYKVTFTDAPGASCPAVAAPAISVKCQMGSTEYGKTLHVQVTAHNALGEGKPGTGEFLYEIVPDAPQPKRADAGLNSVALAWDPPAAGSGTVTSYTVTCGGAVLTGLSPTATTLTVDGLAATRTYVCSVRAVNTKGSSSEAAFPPAVPYGQPGGLAAPAVTRSDEDTVVVSWTPVDDLGAGLTYELFKGSATVAGCTASPCNVPLAPGEHAAFRLKASPNVPGVQTIRSDWTPDYWQWPETVAPLGAVTAPDSSGAAAGSGAITVGWPVIPTGPGALTSTVAYSWSGGPLPGAQTSFTGLSFGSYTFTVDYCLVRGGGEWVGSPGSLCAGETATATVKTLPAVPAGCVATRVDPTDVHVAGCSTPDADGTAPSWQYQLPGSSTWTGMPSNWRVPVGAGAGNIQVRATNGEGAGPGMSVAYDA
jgi:hypothetical protein